MGGTFGDIKSVWAVSGGRSPGGVPLFSAACTFSLVSCQVCCHGSGRVRKMFTQHLILHLISALNDRGQEIRPQEL